MMRRPAATQKLTGNPLHRPNHGFIFVVGRVQKLPNGSWAKSPTGDVFVKPALKKGILPEILEELLGARKRCAHTCLCRASVACSRAPTSIDFPQPDSACCRLLMWYIQCAGWGPSCLYAVCLYAVV